MKYFKLLFLSIFLFVPMVMNGEIYTHDVPNNPVFTYVSEYSEFIKQELPIIESYMMQVNHDFVASLASYTDTQKIVYYKNYLAEMFFEKYYNFFLWDLEEKSKEFGREIKQKVNGDKYADYWLDRGIMDSDKCQSMIYKRKNNSKREQTKQLNYIKDHTCFYPDGFENYSIMYRDDDTIKTLDIVKDDSAKDMHTVYKVSLFRSPYADADNPDDIMASLNLYVSYTVYNYSEWYEWENQRAQDIKDGMYQIIGPKKKSECNEKSPFGCWFIGNDDMEKWKSSKIPDSFGGLHISNWSMIYQSSHTEK